MPPPEEDEVHLEVTRLEELDDGELRPDEEEVDDEQAMPDE